MADQGAGVGAAKNTVFSASGGLPLLFTAVVDHIVPPGDADGASGADLERPCLMFSGGRGTGKTTVLRQIARRLPGRAVFLNLRRQSDLRLLKGMDPLPDGRWLILDNVDADPEAVVARLETWTSLPSLVWSESTAHLAAVGPAWASLREWTTEHITLFPFPPGWEAEQLDRWLAEQGVSPADRPVWREALIHTTAGHPALLGHGLRAAGQWAAMGVRLSVADAEQKISDGTLEAMEWVHQALRDLGETSPQALLALQRMHNEAEYVPDDLSRLRLYAAGLLSPDPARRRPRLPSLLRPLLEAAEPVVVSTPSKDRVVALTSEAVEGGGWLRGREGGRVVVEVMLADQQWAVWQLLEATGRPVQVEDIARQLGVARGGASSAIQRLRTRLEGVGLGGAFANVWGQGYAVQREVVWAG